MNNDVLTLPEVEGMIKALMEGEDVTAYAAVVVRRAVLRRRSHLILLCGCRRHGSIRRCRFRAVPAILSSA